MRSEEVALSRPREPLPTRVEGLPELPTSFRAALDEGLRALRLALAPDARRAIEGHARLLLAWTEAINLTAIRDPEAVARLHVVDSLSALPDLAAVPTATDGTRGRSLRFADLGSGGGYPGIPIAAALPDAHVLLVDSVAKKARFLEVAARAIGLDDRLAVFAGRAEAVASEASLREGHDAVLARAVGSLAELVELAFPLLRVGGVLVAWKRGAIEDEIAAARRSLAALGGGVVGERAVVAPGLSGHRLVTVRKEGPTRDVYPRDPGARRRHPW